MADGGDGAAVGVRLATRRLTVPLLDTSELLAATEASTKPTEAGESDPPDAAGEGKSSDEEDAELEIVREGDLVPAVVIGTFESGVSGESAGVSGSGESGGEGGGRGGESGAPCCNACGSCSITGYAPEYAKRNQDSMVWCPPGNFGTEGRAVRQLQAVQTSRRYHVSEAHPVFLLDVCPCDPTTCLQFAGVFDGHGPGGEVVADFLRQKIGPAVAAGDLGCAGAEMVEVLEKAFAGVAAALLDAESELGVHLRHCGSTATTVLFVGPTMFCANVGDSRTVLAKRGGEAGGSGYVAEDLSRDHKPDDPLERARIVEAGGVVRPAMHMITKQLFGVPRVWQSETAQAPGLAVARAFGDLLAASLGVIAIPEVKERTCEKDDAFIVLGSDGLFEFMSSQAAVDIVGKHLDNGASADEAAEAVAREASRLWELEEESIDDITALVVTLGHAKDV